MCAKEARKTGRKWQVCGQKKEGSPQTIPGIKDNLQERVSTQSVVEKETRKRKNAFRICLKKGTGENSRCPDFFEKD